MALEGLGDVLGDAPDWGGYKSVALASLASWTFSAAPDQTADFRGLAAGLVRGGTPPGDLLLRLSPPGGTSPAEAEVTVPLYLHFLGPRLLDMEALAATDPPSVPVVGGAKVTLTYMLCPGDSVYGKLNPLAA